jgi:carboxyl-terminal processing protease
MSQSLKRAIFYLSVAIILAVFLGGVGVHGVRAGVERDGAYRQMEVYSEVLRKIQTDYVTEPNISGVTGGALHGLLESLDADSSYLTAGEYRVFKQHQGAGTAQVGLNVSKRMGYATIVSVVPGSPADKEQLSDGDLIESIDDQSTHELSLAMINLLLEGKAGTTVSIAVIRPRKPEPDRISLTRTPVVLPAMEPQQYENSSILYLKPLALSRDRVDAIAARLKTMPQSGNRKVLLDLRDVATGDAAEGVRLANFFLRSGTIATLEGQKYPRQSFTADGSRALSDAPLAVLVNHGTSGAAEIVAAAVLDNKRGDVVGERTFGEGAVQKTIEMPDGSAMILSVAKYAAPDGKKFQDDAVTPNVQVAGNDDEDADQSRADEQLNKALALLKAKNA